MQHRRVDRPDLQFDVAGVAKLFRERNVLPAEFRRAHVDGVEIGRGPCQQFSSPALVSKVTAVWPVFSNRRRTTQRMPLPQAPASEPSLL